MPMRRLLTILTLALVALPAASTGVAAAATAPAISIGVAPSKLQANLVPGQVYRTVLDVYNKGADRTVLDVYLQDYTISTASAVQFEPAGALAQSAGPWASLSARVLRMGPHGHAQVHLTVRVPNDAALGTHTLAVVFRSRQVRTNGNVRYRPAVASLMAAGIENRDGTGLLLRGAVVTRSVDVSWPSLGSIWSSSDHMGAAIDWLIHPTVTANVEVRNTGNTFFNIIKGGTEFSTDFALGARSGRAAAPTYTILPNSVRTLTMRWSGPPAFAKGSAHTRIYYNDRAYLPVATTPFMIIPWHLIIVVGLLLAMVILWRIVRRRRRPRRERVAAPSPWLSASDG
jgi:hypothetical protein